MSDETKTTEAPATVPNDIYERAISPEFAAQLMAIMASGPLKQPEPPKARAPQPRSRGRQRQQPPKRRGFFD